ncbi:hypothetical protein VPH35_099477 [Triticum aestivum]
MAIISNILISHPGPARRLSLRSICLRNDSYARFDIWFRTPALNGLEELDFYGRNTQCLVPPSVLRFAPTLRLAIIDGCNLSKIDVAPALLLPRLKQLKLYDIIISESVFHRLLSGGTMLENLDLQSIHGLTVIRIISSTLRSICVYVRHQADMVELIIEDAPCLERLIQPGQEGPRTIRVIAPPKLAVLGYLTPRISKLEHGTIIPEVGQVS